MLPRTPLVLFCLLIFEKKKFFSVTPDPTLELQICAFWHFSEISVVSVLQVGELEESIVLLKKKFSFSKTYTMSLLKK